MRNSITNPNPDCNGDSYGNGYSYRDSYSHIHADTDCHSYTYSYADSKADTDSERYAHTEASPDTAASSVAGNSRLEKSKANEQTNVTLEKFLNKEMEEPTLPEREFLLSCFPD